LKNERYWRNATRRSSVAASPCCQGFQLTLAIRERRRQRLDHGCHELVGLPHSMLRIVDEGCLDHLPLLTEFTNLLLREQLRPWLVSLGFRGVSLGSRACSF
jgi:hypothetical protein